MAPIILHHHEHWDGSGYPNQLLGQETPLLARVFQMVDIYDALACERPHKSAMSDKQVIAIMEQEADRGWRDPALMRVFLDVHATPDSLRLPREVSRTDDEKSWMPYAPRGCSNGMQGGRPVSLRCCSGEVFVSSLISLMYRLDSRIGMRASVRSNEAMELQNF